MTVVRRDARRRWLLVAAGVAVLVALPVGISARPGKTAKVDAGVLSERIRASAGQAYQGYAESVGALGLPPLPRLDRIASLLSTTTRMRAWYAGRDRWRVDVVGTGTERGFYQTPDGHYTWDYGDNQLTHVADRRPLDAADIFVPPGAEIGGEQLVIMYHLEPSARLPRAADLMPPDLARRLLSTAQVGAPRGDRIGAVPGKRVAGIDAAGLRITSADPHTTIGHVDIWADPRTGLALQVEVTARDAERPILVSRFLDLDPAAPAADVLAPPERREGVSLTETGTSDALGAIADPVDPASLPDSIAGRQRRVIDGDQPVETPGGEHRVGEHGVGEHRVTVYGWGTATLYGTGLTQIAVLPLSNRVAGDVYRSIGTWGRWLSFATGDGALVSTALLSVMVVRNAVTRQSFLLAGLVDGVLMEQAGTDLARGGAG